MLEEPEQPKKIRIGVVAWLALPVVSPDQGSSVGGQETRAWLIARCLANLRNTDVTFFVESSEASKEFKREGVLVVASGQWIESIRRDVSYCIDLANRRLKQWRWSLIWKAPFLVASRPWRSPKLVPREPDPRLAQYASNVDIWIVFGCSADASMVAATANAHDRALLVFLRSNADVASSSAVTSNAAIDRYGESAENREFTLTHAKTVVCQTRCQQDILKRDHHINGQVIRNAIDLTRWKAPTASTRNGVLWIGRFDDFHKRVGLATEIARLCSEVPFQMIINKGDPEVESRIRANCPQNVQIIDYVSPEEIREFFVGARVFLCTGHPDYEGFPNVLLQAAASETPIVSSFDFDDFLANSKAGVQFGDSIDTAASQIRDYLGGKQIDYTPVRGYLQEHHSIHHLQMRLKELIESNLSSNNSRE